VGRSFAIPSLELWPGGLVCSQPRCRQGLQERRRELLRLEDRHRTAAEGVGRRHIVVVEDRLGRDHQGREVVDPRIVNMLVPFSAVQYERVNAGGKLDALQRTYPYPLLGCCC
jgi:hypothetical protein